MLAGVVDMQRNEILFLSHRLGPTTFRSLCEQVYCQVQSGNILTSTTSLPALSLTLQKMIDQQTLSSLHISPSTRAVWGPSSLKTIEVGAKIQKQ